MPIRTPKGRGAAYRSLWQWPLRSPARFIGCLVVLLALVVGVNALLGHVFHRGDGRGGVFDDRPGSTQTAPGPVPTDDAAPPPAEPNRLPPVQELSPTTLPPADAPAAALGTATRWTQAWARHPAGTTTQTWVNGLRPYTTEEYLGVLATVDPANVPADKVIGPPRPLLVSPDSVRVEVPTDAVDLVVLVVRTGDAGGTGKGWKVAGYDRADTPAR